MSFSLTWESTDITSDIKLYKRNESICEGTRTLTIEAKDTGRAYSTWNSLIPYEDGNKIGTFFIKEIKDSFDGKITITAQDSSMRLERYFEDRYWTPNYVSTARYWIELWLDRAGVSYNFTTASNGAVINKNVSFGRETTYNLIVPMLQQSGWYMLFDEDNVLQIGSLDVDTKSVSATYDETEITKIVYKKNDKQARNKVIVWGGMDNVSETWITAEAKSKAGWQVDSNDWRSTIISSNAIKTYGSAYLTANKLLNTTIEPTKEKEVTIVGFDSVSVGDLVYISSRVFNGSGLVTDIDVTFDSNSGYMTTLTLDRRCPRLFAYFAWDGHVYVGTRGGGIYRKPFETGVWSSYSSGLDNLNIFDLYIDNSIFVCVAGDGYAYKSTTALGYWIKLHPGEVEDSDENLYEESELRAVACSINDSGEIIVTYNHRTENLAWIVHYNVYSGITRTEQIVIDETETDVTVIDMDNTGETSVISVGGVVNIPGEGLITRNPVAEGTATYTNLDSSGYRIDTTDISNGDYTTKNIAGIKAYHTKYAFRTVSSGGSYDAHIQKVQISGTYQVLGDIDISDKFSTDIQREYVYVIDENTIILDNSFIEGGERYLYKADFEEDTLTQYDQREGNAHFFIVTNDGTTFRVYNTTDPLDTDPSGGWKDGLDPTKWYVSIDAGTGIQIITDDEEDWGLDSGSYDSGYKSQYVYQPIEGVEGELIIPIVEVLEIQDYVTDYYEPDGSKRIHWGMIMFKSAIISSDGTIDINNGPYFETKHDDLCTNYFDFGASYYVENLYAWSDGAEVSVLPNFSDNCAAMVFSLSVYKDGCKWQPDSFDYVDAAYYWCDFFDDVDIAEKESPIYYNYVVNIGETVAILSYEDEATSNPWDNFTDWGHNENTIWGRNGTSGDIETIYGDSPPATNISTLYSIDPKSCDETGKIIGRHNISPYEIKLFGSTAQTIFNSNSSETHFQLIGNHLATEERLLYADSATGKPEYSIGSSTIIKDNYIDSELVVSSGIGFESILAGIPGNALVEISRAVPTFIYTTPGTSYSYSNFTLDENDWNSLGSTYRFPISNARIFFSEDETGAFDGFKVTATSSQDQDIRSGASTLDEEFQIIFSGAIVASGTGLHRIETSNGIDPYFFVSTSGSSTVASEFFQKNPNTESFTDYSSGLPSNNITIIRVDDKIT